MAATRSRVLFLALWTMPYLGAATIQVPAGGDLQRAIDDASPGDTLVLAAGEAYTGNFVLPNKGSNTDYITIQSSRTDGLPQGIRVQPPDARFMAAIVTPNVQPAIDAAEGANHYRLIGLEIRPAAGKYVWDMVRLGYDPKSNEVMPHHFTLDRLYIHGDPAVGSKRGVALNCAYATVQNSYISDFKSTEQDTQAIAGWSGPGPFTITNNYLEAAGENIMFGDPQPSVAGVVPSDITIQRNYLFKPLSWRPGDAGYAGKRWAVKNLFELKSAQRVMFSGNVMENCWASAQVGFAVVLTVRSQNGRNPTAVVKDVVVSNNLIRHVGHGVNILGVDTNGQGQTSEITITNNVFSDVNGAKWSSGAGRLFQILNGARNITVDHNTAFHDGPIIMADERPSPGLVFRNNIVLGTSNGVIGSGTAIGTATLNAYFPEFVFQHNVIVGGNAAQYPPSNGFPKTLSAIGFQDYSNGNLALLPDSPFVLESSDGSAPGADYAALQAQFQAVISGRARPTRRGGILPAVPGAASKKQ